MLGEIIIDDQRMLAAITVIFAHGTTGIRRQILQGWGVRGSSCNHRRISHRSKIFQALNHLGNSWIFLADGHINTDHAGIFLVQDSINDDSCFACLSVAYDQFSLTATNWNHRIYSFDSSLKRFPNRHSFHHSWSQPLHQHAYISFNWPLIIKWLAQRVNNPAD